MRWPNDAFQTADSEDVTVDRKIVDRKERRGEVVGRKERKGEKREEVMERKDYESGSWKR